MKSGSAKSSPVASDTFNPAQSWKLSEQVSIRDESFGALAYHHGNRRLVFLKSRELVGVVRSLSIFESANAAIDVLITVDQRDRYVRALSSLRSSELIRER